MRAILGRCASLMSRPGNDAARKRGGYAMALLAVLTCPCHIPVLALVLAGTAAGAFLAEHFVLSLAAATGVFLASGALALRWLGRHDERQR